MIEYNMIHVWLRMDYAEIVKWVEELGKEHVCFDQTSSITWINGTKYQHRLKFFDPESLMVFKLKFGDR